MRLSRIGDKNNAGGAILRGAVTVFANGRPVGLHPSLISPHRPFTGSHKTAKTLLGSTTVFCEGQPVLFTGCMNSCGHTIIQGSTNIFVR